MFKNLHLTCKDISQIYKEELSIPKFITYPIWFILLIITFLSKKCLNLFRGSKKDG